MSLTPYSFVLGVGCPDNTINVILNGFAGPGSNEFNVRVESDKNVPTTLSVTSWDYQVNDDGIWVSGSGTLTISSGTTGGYTAFDHGSTVTSVQFRINTGTPTTSGIWTIVYT